MGHLPRVGPRHRARCDSPVVRVRPGARESRQHGLRWGAHHHRWSPRVFFRSHSCPRMIHRSPRPNTNMGVEMRLPTSRRIRKYHGGGRVRRVVALVASAMSARPPSFAIPRRGEKTSTPSARNHQNRSLAGEDRSWWTLAAVARVGRTTERPRRRWAASGRLGKP